MTEAKIIETAIEAGKVAALAVWARDEKMDRGSCGGAMLAMKRNTKLYKAALAAGIASNGCEFIRLPMPEGVWSQNADIPQAQYRAFLAVIREAGLEKAVSRFWTYID